LSSLGRKARRTLAVSTVISTVLMTMLSVTLGTVIFFWASQTFGVYQGNAGNYFSSRGAALQEIFAVEDVWFNMSGSTKYMWITVRNTGTIDIKIGAIYVDGTSTYTTSPSLGTSGYQVTVGAAVTFRITYTGSKSFSSSNNYFLQVATLRGNQVSTYWTYP